MRKLTFSVLVFALAGNIALAKDKDSDSATTIAEKCLSILRTVTFRDFMSLIPGHIPAIKNERHNLME